MDPLQKLTLTLLVRAIDCAEAVDSALCRTCLYRVPRAFALDTILGPAEQFEYVSTTTPSSPPPTLS